MVLKLKCDLRQGGRVAQRQSSRLITGWLGVRIPPRPPKIFFVARNSLKLAPLPLSHSASALLSSLRLKNNLAGWRDWVDGLRNALSQVSPQKIRRCRRSKACRKGNPKRNSLQASRPRLPFLRTAWDRKNYNGSVVSDGFEL